MTAPNDPAHTNRLLGMLSDRSERTFMASGDCVDLEFAAVLCTSGKPITHIYFPLDSFISLVTTLDDGERLEVGIVGDEGMLGISLVLGVAIAPQDAIVQGSGTALRMNAAVFLGCCKRNPLLRQVLNRYACVLMSQLAQTAACTHYHVVEARLARWLLATRDRARSNRFHLTHKFLAYMLGVRRVGITHAAGELHKRGLINYSRGEIVVLDGPGLERASCGCYRQGKNTYARALPSSRRAARHA